MNFKSLSPPEKWIILSIPILFILGSLMHFLYDFTGNITLVGLISPVNESIWEHLKLVLLPIILFWFIYYFLNGKKYNINKEKWFLGCVISLVFSMLTILAFNYTYTQAFGIQWLPLDIFNLFLSITVGQFMGLHFYRYSEGVRVFTSLLILILILGIFILFTISPPHIPLFRDATTGQFGI